MKILLSIDQPSYKLSFDSACLPNERSCIKCENQTCLDLIYADLGQSINFDSGNVFQVKDAYLECFGRTCTFCGAESVEFILLDDKQVIRFDQAYQNDDPIPEF